MRYKEGLADIAASFKSEHASEAKKYSGRGQWMRKQSAICRLQLARTIQFGVKQVEGKESDVQVRDDVIELHPQCAHCVNGWNMLLAYDGGHRSC